MSTDRPIQMTQNDINQILDLFEETIQFLEGDDAKKIDRSRLKQKFESVGLRLQVESLTNIVEKLKKSAHDIAAASQKQVHVVAKGFDLSVPLAVRDSIWVALLHLCRNAISHGIELPDERLRAEKTPIGTISLRAQFEGGALKIEFADDGRGLNWVAVAEQAKAQGLISEPVDIQGLKPSQKEELAKVIFEPNFSTRKEVDTQSGRGLGLDIVRSTVGRFGGSALVRLDKESGFAIEISLPIEVVALSAKFFGIGENGFWVMENSIQSIDSGEDVDSEDPAVRIAENIKGEKLDKGFQILTVRASNKSIVRVAVETVGGSDYRIFRQIDPSWLNVDEKNTGRWIRTIDKPMLATRVKEELMPLLDYHSFLNWLK